MSDNKFFAYLWSLFTVVIVSLIISVMTYNLNVTNNTLLMVEKGVDPMLAACSTGMLQNPSICTAVINVK